jgi:hypothetical protein
MRFTLTITICALVAVALAGCGGGGGGGGTTGSGGSGRIQLFLTDAPINAEALNVQFSMICVHTDTSDWQTIKTYSEKDPAINLLDYQAKYDLDADPATLGSCQLLDAKLDAGHYTMVRIHVGAMNIVVGGISYPVDLSDVEPNGILLPAEFDVAKGTSVSMLIHLDARESIVMTPTGGYKLKPVASILPKDTAASITGTVTFKDAAQNAVSVPDGGVSAGIFQPGASKPINTVPLDVDQSKASGTFTAGALAPGTYDIKVSATGYSPGTVRLAGVTVGAAEAKNVGEIAVSPP